MSGVPPTGFHREPRNLRVHQSSCRRCRALAELPALTIVDLACGTGSTLRACTTSALQNWKLVDNDLARWCVPPTRGSLPHGNDHGNWSCVRS